MFNIEHTNKKECCRVLHCVSDEKLSTMVNSKQI